jgi:phage tail sheath protein FI
LSDAPDRGITVTEIAPMDQPIDIAPETTAAFVGRALRGPLNTPVLVQHFGEFRRRFGDVWTRSSLGPAVKQFFEHGGKRLYIVRVANKARGAMLCLPAGGSGLVLRAVDPGSTEQIRASVDYDDIDDDNAELFNLTLQRIDPANGFVAGQEMFRGLSFVEDADTFVADALLASTIVRVEQPYPAHRPDCTTSGDSRYDLTWVGHAQEGADGVELSDYDLIGSRNDATGLFALEQVDTFDILYLPPLGKFAEVGPAAILAAEMFCRQRAALLLLDPASTWTSADDVIDGIRELGYASPNMLSYFPRMLTRGDREKTPRVVAAAIAGLLCKQDRNFGTWHTLDHDMLGFNRKMTPATLVDEDERYALHRAGINVIASRDRSRAHVEGSRTMARGSESYRIFRNLAVRRLCLRIITTIDLATRWAVFEKPDVQLTKRLRAQILGYFASLEDMGAFANARFVVECDAGLCKREDRLEHGVTILLIFHPIASPDPVSLSLHQTVAGFRVASTAFAPVAEDCA